MNMSSLSPSEFQLVQNMCIQVSTCIIRRLNRRLRIELYRDIGPQESADRLRCSGTARLCEWLQKFKDEG